MTTKLAALVAVVALAGATGCASCGAQAGTARNLSKLVHFEGDRIEVEETIQFETGSATIAAASTDLLDAVADILKNTPAIAKLTIEGHTDSTGDAEMNKSLSQKRADAVKDYIVAKGIDAARLASVGFGAEKPIASNDTDEGRAKNRRVEFKVGQ